MEDLVRFDSPPFDSGSDWSSSSGFTTLPDEITTTTSSTGGGAANIANKSDNRWTQEMTMDSVSLLKLRSYENILVWGAGIGDKKKRRRTFGSSFGFEISRSTDSGRVLSRNSAGLINHVNQSDTVTIANNRSGEGKSRNSETMLLNSEVELASQKRMEAQIEQLATELNRMKTRIRELKRRNSELEKHVIPYLMQQGKACWNYTKSFGKSIRDSRENLLARLNEIQLDIDQMGSERIIREKGSGYCTHDYIVDSPWNGTRNDHIRFTSSKGMVSSSGSSRARRVNVGFRSFAKDSSNGPEEHCNTTDSGGNISRRSGDGKVGHVVKTVCKASGSRGKSPSLLYKVNSKHRSKTLLPTSSVLPLDWTTTAHCSRKNSFDITIDKSKGGLDQRNRNNDGRTGLTGNRMIKSSASTSNLSSVLQNSSSPLWTSEYNESGKSITSEAVQWTNGGGDKAKVASLPINPRNTTGSKGYQTFRSQQSSRGREGERRRGRGSNSQFCRKNPTGVNTIRHDDLQNPASVSANTKSQTAHFVRSKGWKAQSKSTAEKQSDTLTGGGSTKKKRNKQWNGTRQSQRRQRQRQHQISLDTSSSAAVQQAKVIPLPHTNCTRSAGNSTLHLPINSQKVNCLTTQNYNNDSQLDPNRQSEANLNLSRIPLSKYTSLDNVDLALYSVESPLLLTNLLRWNFLLGFPLYTTLFNSLLLARSDISRYTWLCGLRNNCPARRIYLRKQIWTWRIHFISSSSSSRG